MHRSTDLAQALWAPLAWVQGHWRESVLLQVAAGGTWAIVAPDTPRAPDMTTLPGPALPGMVNAHSHAFQRAFVGLAERRDGEHDDFWSWRDRMYGVALTITPERLREVATHLYTELLRSGYTQVCEFHYLHRAPDGSRYDDPLAMSRALVQAAQDTGIGLTLLPVLYERAGFDAAGLRSDQRRFATTVDDVLALRDGVRALNLPNVSAGVAIHSLRAARASSILRVAERTAGDSAPIHIHIAEQTGEVDDCVVASGLRPIDWLARHVALDARWQLVHATHATVDEISAVAASGAGVVLCPTTEANLGDGLFPLAAYLDAGGRLGIGSDSHVSVSPIAELRWLEYGQRLFTRSRNVAAGPSEGERSTGARLYRAALAGGAQALARPVGAIAPGRRADFLVVDDQHPLLYGRSGDLLLDSLVFSGDENPIRDVMIGGNWVVRDRVHQAAERVRTRFRHTMDRLLA
jgi:formimidoylglutamate deiminase